MQERVYYSRVEAAAYATEEVLGVARVGEEAVDERGAVARGEPGDVDLAEHVVALDGRGAVGSRGPEQAPSRAGDGGEPLQRRPPQRLPLVLRLPPRPRARERRLRRPHRLAAGRADRSPPPRRNLASSAAAAARAPFRLVGGAAVRGFKEGVLAGGGNGGLGREGVDPPTRSHLWRARPWPPSLSDDLPL